MFVFVRLCVYVYTYCLCVCVRVCGWVGGCAVILHLLVSAKLMI